MAKNQTKKKTNKILPQYPFHSFHYVLFIRVSFICFSTLFTIFFYNVSVIVFLFPFSVGSFNFMLNMFGKVIKKKYRKTLFLKKFSVIFCNGYTLHYDENFLRSLKIIMILFIICTFTHPDSMYAVR